MSGTRFDRLAEVWWSPRRSRGVLVATLLPFLALAPLITAAGLEEPPQSWWLAGLLAIAIGAIQLRHSFAAARGVRPSGWPVTLMVLGFLVFLPLIWFQWDWASTQYVFIASAAMLLRGRLMRVVMVAPLLGTYIAAVISNWIEGGPIQLDVFFFFYWEYGLIAGAACLYGTSQFVRAVDALFATRAELAETTVGRERLRFSRDLHDLLGQSLSAVSLKGDLAILLLRSDPSAAEAELHSLTQAARDALRDTRRVVRGEHPVTLRGETQGAAALLAAASIHAHIDVELQHLAPQVDELFGWATREGVTNMVRHSQAGTCSIRASRREGRAFLEIINDGAGPANGSGTGIDGLTERARALSGQVDAGLIGGGRYCLSIAVPEAFV